MSQVKNFREHFNFLKDYCLEKSGTLHKLDWEHLEALFDTAIAEEYNNGYTDGQGEYEEPESICT